MPPARFSAIIAKVRLAAAHAHTIKAEMPVLPVEVSDHLAAIREHLRSIDADLRALRDGAPPAQVVHLALVSASARPPL